MGQHRRRKKWREFICETCGKTFKSKSTKARFCLDGCRLQRNRMMSRLAITRHNDRVKASTRVCSEEGCDNKFRGVVSRTRCEYHHKRRKLKPRGPYKAKPLITKPHDPSKPIVLPLWLQKKLGLGRPEYQILRVGQLSVQKFEKIVNQWTNKEIDFVR